MIPWRPLRTKRSSSRRTRLRPPPPHKGLCCPETSKLENNVRKRVHEPECGQESTLSLHRLERIKFNSIRQRPMLSLHYLRKKIEHELELSPAVIAFRRTFETARGVPALHGTTASERPVSVDFTRSMSIPRKETTSDSTIRIARRRHTPRPRTNYAGIWENGPVDTRGSLSYHRGIPHHAFCLIRK